MELKLVPLECHQQNSGKVSIHTLKDKYISILVRTFHSFLMDIQERDGLLPHAEILTNILCQLNASPKVFVSAHLSGPFDYNKMPLAPMKYATKIYKNTNSFDMEHAQLLRFGI